MLRIILPAFAALFINACQSSQNHNEHSPSESGASLRLWAMARTFPDGRFYTGNYADALSQMNLEARLAAKDRGGTWDAIGPKNIGGRTLCLAIHPLDTNIMYAGSASGGLWKSTTAGIGPQAWQRVETGYPILGISAIAIDPKNPALLYIGTGEVYNLENSMPNVAFRTTRGTYGIGILKSTDGGLTWTKSLDWSYGELRGVQDIKINPLRTSTLYAATTEGLLRSYDAGASWQTVFNHKMAVDIEINSADTNMIFTTFGSLDDQDISGVYRSVNGGNSFQLLNNGIASAYSGKALLGLCPGQPGTIYASVGNAFNQAGLYKSTNSGASWIKVSNEDVCTYQGWYSHDIAVHPTNANRFIWVGVDAWKSDNGGMLVQKTSYWDHWYFGQVPAGGPEGPADYVHADIHRVYWLEQHPNKVYCVSDGGIFVSYDSGETWAGRNGGYQTQQFYANLGNSATNPSLCIGGMQDNATAIYTGAGDWTRVIGGDGECAAISPVDDQVMFGSAQYLFLVKSTDGGASFYPIVSDEMNNENALFNGPFELAPSTPQTMYAGAQSLYRSDDQGESWVNVSGGFIAQGDAILTIAVDPANADLVYCSTAPSVTNQARVFKIDVAGGQTTQMTGLPNRLCMDIVFDPFQPNTAYVVFAGFNTGHVWKTVDGGISWANIDNGLPDIPTNTLLADPMHPNHIYIGNDLGVWLSRNGGSSWELFSAGAPNAMLVMHLSATPDRKLRVATHGLGVWQTPLAEAVGTNAVNDNRLALQLAPNPVAERLTVNFNLPVASAVRFRVVDAQGRELRQIPSQRMPSGDQTLTLDCAAWPPGLYGIILDGKAIAGAQVFRGSRIFVKR